MLVPFCVSRISIHAPAKGATERMEMYIDFAIFQSTLPRRERLHFILRLICSIYFNPRSREGSDENKPEATQG